MKFRDGFVTNSSSSSFIIKYKTKVNIPDQYKNIVKELTSEKDIIEFLEEVENPYDYFDGLSEQEIINTYHFSETQINFLKALKMNQAALYQELCHSIHEDDTFIYSATTDNDYSYNIMSLFEDREVMESWHY